VSAQTRYRGKPFIILGASPDRRTFGTVPPPGTVTDITNDGVSVACSDGFVVLREFLDADAKSLSIDRLVEYYGITPGSMLD
tara:strand:- start:773 stop:1018 length:246 start_codon:yes stop_codon:yes gene_type:complete